MTDVYINVATATLTFKLMYPCIQTWIDLPTYIPTYTESRANAIVTLGAGISQSSIIKKTKKHLLSLFFNFKTSPYPHAIKLTR